jgi:hypothetical protein
MAIQRWALALGATLLLCAPSWAAAGTAENLDFRLDVDSIAWTATGFVVKAQIENRTGSPDLFLHHEANRDEADGFTHTPTDPGAATAQRRSFTLKGLTNARSAVTLAFGVGANENAGLLIVGEARAPYRQVAIALKPLLPERPPAPAPTAKAPSVDVSGVAPHARAEAEGLAEGPSGQSNGPIKRFRPPHASLGASIALWEGKAGPQGDGWTRLYTELPEITLDELSRVLESPAQIWHGPEGYLYLRNVGGQRALAVSVRDAQVISARYVTPQTLGQVLGPKTRYPKRIYMGRP